MVRLMLVETKYLPAVIDVEEFVVEEQGNKHIGLVGTFIFVERPHHMDFEKIVDKVANDVVGSKALVTKVDHAQLVEEIHQEIHDFDGVGIVITVAAAIVSDLLITHSKFVLVLIINGKVDTGIPKSDYEELVQVDRRVVSGRRRVVRRTTTASKQSLRRGIMVTKMTLPVRSFDNSRVSFQLVMMG